MAEDMARLVADAGLDPRSFRGARQLSSTLVQEAALILTMAKAHRAQMVEHVPAALRRTFTLKEFARLAATVAPAELSGLPTSAARLAGIMARVRLTPRRYSDGGDGNIGGHAVAHAHRPREACPASIPT